MKCWQCGQKVKLVTYRGSDMYCQKCDANLSLPGGTARPAVLVRNYTGRTQSDATVRFQADAAQLAGLGYQPVAQSWMDGRAGIGRALTLGLGANVLRPDGTLSVTYQMAAASAPAVAALAPSETKVCPMCAEEIKAAALVCRFCRFEFPEES